MKTLKLEISDLDKKVLPGWSVVAATGFCMPLKSPITIKSLLCQEWGITSKYLDDRIQTLLLNSSPVDNPETIRVSPGDTLTLSGAMPGLAGAILRKGGVLAGMRHSISAQNEEALETKSKWVTVKLFNLVIDDLRALFLGQGIFLPVEQGLDFLRKVAVAIPADEQLLLGSQSVQWEAVWALANEGADIHITIVSPVTSEYSSISD